MRTSYVPNATVPCQRSVGSVRGTAPDTSKSKLEKFRDYLIASLEKGRHLEDLTLDGFHDASGVRISTATFASYMTMVRRGAITLVSPELREKHRSLLVRQKATTRPNRTPNLLSRVFAYLGSLPQNHSVIMSTSRESFCKTMQVSASVSTDARYRQYKLMYLRKMREGTLPAASVPVPGPTLHKYPEAFAKALEAAAAAESAAAKPVEGAPEATVVATPAAAPEDLVRLLTKQPSLPYKALVRILGRPVLYSDIKAAKEGINEVKRANAKFSGEHGKPRASIFQTLSVVDADLDPVAFAALEQIVRDFGAFANLDLRLECVTLPSPQVRVTLAPKG